MQLKQQCVGSPPLCLVCWLYYCEYCPSFTNATTCTQLTVNGFKCKTHLQSMHTSCMHNSCKKELTQWKIQIKSSSWSSIGSATTVQFLYNGWAPLCVFVLGPYNPFDGPDSGACIIQLAIQEKTFCQVQKRKSRDWCAICAVYAYGYSILNRNHAWVGGAF